MSPPEEGGLKESRDAEDKTVTSYSTLRNILPPQLNKMTDRYKIMYYYECCISTKSMHSYLLTWCYCHLKHLKDGIHNAKNRSMVNYQVAYLKPIKFCKTSWM